MAPRAKRIHTGWSPTVILARLPLSPLEFRPENLEVAATRGFNKSKGAVAAADGHLVAGEQLKALLAVEGQEYLIPFLHVGLDSDRRGRRNHDRAVGQGVWCDRGEKQRVDARLDDRAAGGEVVGRRAGRG